VADWLTELAYLASGPGPVPLAVSIKAKMEKKLKEIHIASSSSVYKTKLQREKIKDNTQIGL